MASLTCKLSLHRSANYLFKRRFPLSNTLGSHVNYSNRVYHPDAEGEVPIPEYKERTGESIHVQKARLVYQSRKRGMLENDLLLSTFAGKYLDLMTADQVKTYDKLINKPSNDWEIYHWAIGEKPTPTEYESDVMDMLKTHARNKDLEVRLRQPDLKL